MTTTTSSTGSSASPFTTPDTTPPMTPPTTPPPSRGTDAPTSPPTNPLTDPLTTAAIVNFQRRVNAIVKVFEYVAGVGEHAPKGNIRPALGIDIDIEPHTLFTWIMPGRHIKVLSMPDDDVFEYTHQRRINVAMPPLQFDTTIDGKPINLIHFSGNDRRGHPAQNADGTTGWVVVQADFSSEEEQLAYVRKIQALLVFLKENTTTVATVTERVSIQ